MRKLLKSLICTFLTAALLISMTAVNASAAKPKLNKTSVNVPIDYSVTVKVTGATNVKWSSSDESVAAVKADGASAKITGKKTGSATISAKVGSTTLKCAVTVKKSFITPSEESVAVSKGKSKTITLKVSGSKDIAISNSDKDVCSASWGKWDGNSIKLTLKGKANGNAVITVYTKKYSKSTAQKISVKVGSSDDGEIIGDDNDNAAESSDASREGKIVELVNKERKAKGLSSVEMDEELNAIAAMRAKELAKEFSHTRPDGTSYFTALDDAGYERKVSAENAAYNSSSSETGVMKQWMNSSGHKANILKKDVTKMGVGCYEVNGIYYWIQIFVG